MAQQMALRSLVNAQTADIADEIDILKGALLNKCKLDKGDADHIIDTLKVNIAYLRQDMPAPPAAAVKPARDGAPPPAAATPAPDVETFARPDFLPDDGPPQMSMRPENWAITFSQFRRLLNCFKADPLYKVLKETKGYVSLYDLNVHAMMPWTARSPCGVALLLNQGGLPADFMLSHAWGEDVEELEGALAACFKSHGLEGTDPAIWICWAALYQAKAAYADAPGPPICEQLALRPFEEVIATKQAGKLQALIAVHTTREDMYKRLWCPKELFEALRMLVDVWMAASEQYSEELSTNFQFWRGLAGNDEEAIGLWLKAGAGVRGMALAIETESARCSSPEDERMIRKEIEDWKGGYAVLDNVVVALRKRNVIQIMKAKDLAKSMQAGLAPAELRKQLGASPHDLLEIGCPRDALLGAGYSDQELRRAGFGAGELKAAGRGGRDLKHSGFDAGQLKQAAFSLQDLKEAAFTAQELKQAGFTTRQLKEAGFDVLQLFGDGFSLQELNEAGFKKAELDARQLKGAGLSARQLKEAGFDAGQLKEAGFDAPQLKEAGFDAGQLTWPGVNTWAGFSAPGFSLQDLKEAGFDAPQLKKAGFDAPQLKEAGFDAPQLRGAGFDAPQLKKAGFDAPQLKGAGFDVRQLKKAGFSLRQLTEAGFWRTQLIGAGFSPQEADYY